ncbi:MAG: DnaB-like helicase C-terminal domain-containing protein, partial [Pseudomonadota bacterium]
MDGNAPFQGHEPRGLPSNIEAEQALLGALLINNDVWSHVSGSLRAEHFYDAVHARIYAAAGQHIDADRLANATTLKALMEDDAGLQEIGGSRYLARLAGAAISVKSAPAYACEIIEAWRRRQVIAAAEALSEAARTGDVSEHVQAAEDAFAEAVTDADARKVAYSGIEAITDALHAVNEVYQGEAPPITPTGFGGFDSHTGGLRAGDLVLLGARPSMGKSAVLVEVMRRAASSGVPVVFVSGEMSPASLMLRAISAEVSGERQIQYARAMRENAMSEADMRAFIEGARRLDHNASGLISIIDAPAPRISLVESETRRALRRLRTRAGESARPPIVIVDYVQIVQGSDPKASQIARVSEVSIRLKALAKREGAAVIAA